MSTMDNPPEQSAGADQVQQWLTEAEVAAKAQDWDRTVALYRKALDFDRALQGVEAKLQWALRMREIDVLYQEGKAKLEAGDYPEALQLLRRARVMYASHYKDADELIVQAQTALQKSKWGERPALRSALRKEQRRRDQRRLLIILGGAVAVIVIAVIVWTGAFGLLAARDSGAANANQQARSLAPEQRNDMYKSLPAMQIDTNKTYRATIKTAKGDIVAELFVKDAPQHVNSFVFLARQGFYDNLTFHRVEPGFVIQGGDPLGNGTGGPGYNIPPEINRKHLQGALAMARRGGPAATTPSSGSQFYITLDAQPSLDGQYTVFGQTTPESLPVIQQIQKGDVIQTITIEEK